MKNIGLEFLREAFDTLEDNICIIDTLGEIVFVNKSWVEFGSNNDLQLERSKWIGMNYLNVCQSATESDLLAKSVYNGIQDILGGSSEYLECEYPCHSPEELRWFIVSVKPMYFGQTQYLIICHHDITRRKLAEDEVSRLASTDFLTGALTRTKFDEVVGLLWKRSCEESSKLCIAMIDLDDFKKVNDNFGHIFGDECLRHVGSLIQAQLPNCEDIYFARFGGEEFILISTLPFKIMNNVMSKIRKTISSTKVFSETIASPPKLTVSAGLVELKPSNDENLNKAISVADGFLYQAKKEGKNRIISQRYVF